MIETIVLKCPDPEVQCAFYRDILGMKDFGDNSVGYGGSEASLRFLSSEKPYEPHSDDRYWKIALSVPDIELAYRQLTSKGIEVGLPYQFKDVGYLAHFKDPAGFTIELIDHKFKGVARTEDVDSRRLGGGAHLSLVTLRTFDWQSDEASCLTLGMKPLSIQPVEDRGFTLYFYAFTDDCGPDADLKSVKNRPWLYQRPYTVLEFQYRHEQGRHRGPPSDQDAGFSGVILSENIPHSEKPDWRMF